MRKIAILGAALVASLSFPLFAQDAGSSSHDLNVATDEFRDAVRSPNASLEDVGSRGAAFAHGLPATTIGIRFHKTEWLEFNKPDASKSASIESILSAGHSALAHARSMPDEKVIGSAERGDQMYNDGKMGFDDLGPSEAGEYRYNKDSKELGKIQLNLAMKNMGRLVPQELLYATVIHEACHANDHQDGKLNPNEVLKGEISAFQCEEAYLRAITKDGEQLGSTARRLDALLKNPGAAGSVYPIIKRADEYVWSLVFLHRTKGDEGLLKTYVEKMGYQEGQQKGSSSPYSP